MRLARKVAAILLVLSGILLFADRRGLVYSESAMPILRKLGLAEVHVSYPHGLAPLESVQVVYAAALRTVVGTGVTLILGGTCLFITAGWRRRVKNPSGDFTLSKL